MARINLMPWREKRRKERQQAFVAMVGLAAAVAVGLLILAWMARAGQIDAQADRNALLKREIDLMKEKVTQIQDLDIKRDRLLGRKQVIEDLQSNRSHMVHLFDEIVRTLPDGIQLVAIEQKGSLLTLEGRSESNSRVSEYLNRLEASAWLERADLRIIEEQVPTGPAASPDAAMLPYFFRLHVTQVNPNAPVLDADGNPVDPATIPAVADPALPPAPGMAPADPSLPPPPSAPVGQADPSAIQVPGQATLEDARQISADAEQAAADDAAAQATPPVDAPAPGDPGVNVLPPAQAPKEL